MIVKKNINIFYLIFKYLYLYERSLGEDLFNWLLCGKDLVCLGRLNPFQGNH